MLTVTTDDGLRAAAALARLTQARVLGDMLSTAGLGWTAELMVAPAVYDERGERVCDAVLAPCAAPAPPAVEVAVADRGGGGLKVTVVVAAAGSIAAVLVVLVCVAAVRNRAGRLIGSTRDVVSARRVKDEVESARRRRPQLVLGQLVMLDEDGQCFDNKDEGNFGPGYAAIDSGKAAQPIGAVVAHVRQRTASPPMSAVTFNNRSEGRATPYWTASAAAGLNGLARFTSTPSDTPSPGSQPPLQQSSMPPSSPAGSPAPSAGSLLRGSPMAQIGGMPPARSAAAAEAAAGLSRSPSLAAAYAIPRTMMAQLVADAALAAEEAANRDNTWALASPTPTPIKFLHPPGPTPTNDAAIVAGQPANEGSMGSHPSGSATALVLSQNRSLLIRATRAREIAARAMETILPAAAWASSIPDLENGIDDCDHGGDLDGSPVWPARRGRTPVPSLAASTTPSFVPSSLSAAGRLAGVRTPLEELRSRSRSRSRGRTPPSRRLRMAHDGGSSDSDGLSSLGPSRPATPSRQGRSLDLDWDISAGSVASGPARSATPAPAPSSVAGQQRSTKSLTNAEGRSSARPRPSESDFSDRRVSQTLPCSQESGAAGRSWAGTVNPDPGGTRIAELPSLGSHVAANLAADSGGIYLADRLSKEASPAIDHKRLLSLSAPPAGTAWVAEGVPPDPHALAVVLKPQPIRLTDGRARGEVEPHSKAAISFLEPNSAWFALPTEDVPTTPLGISRSEGGARGWRPAASAPPGVWVAEMHLAGPAGRLAENTCREGSAPPGGGGMRRRQPPLLV